MVTKTKFGQESKHYRKPWSKILHLVPIQNQKLIKFFMMKMELSLIPPQSKLYSSQSIKRNMSKISSRRTLLLKNRSAIVPLMI